MDVPLEKTFDLSSSEGIEDLCKFLDVNIPDDPRLKDVAKLALDAYRAQMEQVGIIDPKYRQRYMEVAKGYLDTALEALKSIEDVRVRDDKLTLDKNKFEGKQEEKIEEGSYSRKQILDELEQRRKQKAGS